MGTTTTTTRTTTATTAETSTTPITLEYEYVYEYEYEEEFETSTRKPDQRDYLDHEEFVVPGGLLDNAINNHKEATSSEQEELTKQEEVQRPRVSLGVVPEIP